MTATIGNNLEIVKTLITAGANVNLSNKKSETALMLATNKKIIEILENVHKK